MEGVNFLGGLKFNVKFNVKCAERLNSPPSTDMPFPQIYGLPLLFLNLSLLHIF